MQFCLAAAGTASPGSEGGASPASLLIILRNSTIPQAQPGSWPLLTDTCLAAAVAAVPPFAPLQPEVATPFLAGATALFGPLLPLRLLKERTEPERGTQWRDACGHMGEALALGQLQACRHSPRPRGGGEEEGEGSLAPTVSLHCYDSYSLKAGKGRVVYGSFVSLPLQLLAGQGTYVLPGLPGQGPDKVSSSRNMRKMHRPKY